MQYQRHLASTLPKFGYVKLSSLNHTKSSKLFSTILSGSKTKYSKTKYSKIHSPKIVPKSINFALLKRETFRNALRKIVNLYPL